MCECVSVCGWVCVGECVSVWVGVHEKQIPYDLSAENPEVGRLFMVRGRWTVVCVQV